MEQRLNMRTMRTTHTLFLPFNCCITTEEWTETLEWNSHWNTSDRKRKIDRDILFLSFACDEIFSWINVYSSTVRHSITCAYNSIQMDMLLFSHRAKTVAIVLSASIRTYTDDRAVHRKRIEKKVHDLSVVLDLHTCSMYHTQTDQTKLRSYFSLLFYAFTILRIRYCFCIYDLYCPQQMRFG